MVSLVGHVLLVAIAFFIMGIVAGHYVDTHKVNIFYQPLWVVLITVFVWFPALMMGVWVSLKCK
jgi:hypothetical protein